MDEIEVDERKTNRTDPIGRTTGGRGVDGHGATTRAVVHVDVGLPSQARSRRRALACIGASALAGVGWCGMALAATAVSARVEVWKSPTCGCCKEWIAHMRAEGFDVSAHDTGNTAARVRLGMPEKFGSCHTAQVAGYVLEGHVPAQDVRRLLATRPVALGLSVPGMPVGSPGMDGPEYGGRRDAYDVMLVRRDGSATVFRSVR